MLTGQIIPIWRIYGPLELPDFYLPIVARTGEPGLPIKWAQAIEFLYFSPDSAMEELQRLMLAYVEGHALDETAVSDPTLAHLDVRSFFAQLAERPGMWGVANGWALRCLFAGMEAGGDWLGLPELPSVSAAVREIEQKSRDAYGSTWAAYRAYSEKPKALLAWVSHLPA